MTILRMHILGGHCYRFSKIEQKSENLHTIFNSLERRFACFKNKSLMYFHCLRAYYIIRTDLSTEEQKCRFQLRWANYRWYEPKYSRDETKYCRGEAKFSCNRPSLKTMTHQLHEMNFIITNYDVTLAIRETSRVEW